MLVNDHAAKRGVQGQPVSSIASKPETGSQGISTSPAVGIGDFKHIVESNNDEAAIAYR